MTRFIRTAAILGAAAAIGACATSSGSVTPENGGQGAAAPANNTTDQVAGNALTWTTRLQPQAGTNVSGTASAVASSADTRVTVTLTGAMSGDVHPWHVHTGQCGSNGPIVGPASSYPPLAVDAGGGATARATLPLALTMGTNYYVNVHKSSTEMGTIISCGDLATTGNS